MNFIKRKFFTYYLKPNIEFPDRFDRREYAFIIDDVMHRHISFSSKDSLLSYLKINVPMHCYYSSAYYKEPSAESMQDKKWMGAELIFDLDADHLPHVTNLSYEEALDEVKKELKKLLSFLIEDFGFREKEISIYFSGGRGYHCHVINKEILTLTSKERREIVDYIMARGIDIDEVVKERKIEKRMGGKIYFDKTYEIFPQQGGWKGRIAREIIRFLKRIKEMERENAIEMLMQFEGIGKKLAEEIYDKLSDERLRRIEEGRIDQGKAFKKIANSLAIRLSVTLQSGADEPVTADIKRLIRLPGSLHGKTGLMVKKINIDELDEFNPLNDAIVFGDDLVEIKILKPFKIKMMENEYNLKKGSVKVPEYLAVFLVGRGIGIV